MGDQVSRMSDVQQDSVQSDSERVYEIGSASATLLSDINNKQLEDMRANFQEICDKHIEQLNSIHDLGLGKLTEDEQKRMQSLKNVEKEIADLKECVAKFADMFSTLKIHIDDVRQEAKANCELMHTRCESALKIVQEEQKTARDIGNGNFMNLLTKEAMSIRNEAMIFGQQYNKYVDLAIRRVKNEIVEQVQLDNEKLSKKLREEMTSLREESTTANDDLELKINNLETMQKDLNEKFSTRLVYADDDILPGAGDPRTLQPVVFLWKIPKFHSKLLGLLSGSLVQLKPKEPFYFGFGLYFSARLVTDHTNSVLLIMLDFTNKEDGKPKETFLHTRRFVLYDQSLTSEPENIEMQDTASFGMNKAEDMTMSTFNNCQFCGLEYLVRNKRFVKKDEIVIKIIMEPIAKLPERLESMNGALEWKIPNYKKKKQEEIDGGKLWLVSPPFSTSPWGYYLQLDLFLNGDEDYKSECISLYLQVIMSSFDDTLTVPFRCRITFKLIDQIGNDDIVSVKDYHVFTLGNTYFGFPDFVHQDLAESPKYLKDDTIIIKALVEVLKPDGPSNLKKFDDDDSASETELTFSY